jgi:hypothetical protein
MFIFLFDIYTNLYLFADKLDFGICRNPTAFQYTRNLRYVEQPPLKGRSVVVVQDEIKCITRRTKNDTRNDCVLRRQTCFKILEGQSEAENTIAKIKIDKRTNTDLQNTTQETKD